MKAVIASFWRALLDSFSPRIMGLSLLPLGLIVVAALLLGYFYWHIATATMAAWMDSSRTWVWISERLAVLGLQNPTELLAPVLVVALVTPVLVILSLLLVTMFMTPAIARDVGRQRFADLQMLGRTTFVHSLAWSCMSTALAIVALLVSVPLWVIPPLALVLPPLIWGWLAYRVLSFDVLAQHAQASERQWILQRHRWPLLLIGVISGFLGAAPSVVWASGVLFAVAFPVLIPVAVWLFTWVFALTSLWYTHYCLEALQRLRSGQDSTEKPAPLPPSNRLARTPETTRPNLLGTRETAADVTDVADVQADVQNEAQGDAQAGSHADAKPPAQDKAPTDAPTDAPTSEPADAARDSTSDNPGQNT